MEPYFIDWKEIKSGYFEGYKGGLLLFKIHSFINAESSAIRYNLLGVWDSCSYVFDKVSIAKEEADKRFSEWLTRARLTVIRKEFNDI